MSIQLLQDLKDLMATFVSTAMDQFLLHMYTPEQPHQAQQAAPARKFKKLAMLLQLVVLIKFWLHFLYVGFI